MTAATAPGGPGSKAAGQGAASRFQRWRPSPRRGWAVTLAGLVVGAIVTVLIMLDDGQTAWISDRGAVTGIALLAAGLLGGSVRVIGLASLPMLAAAALSLDDPTGVHWGRALIIGCLWYVAMEMSWHAVELRDDVDRSRAVSRRRQQEVATVVMVSVAAGFVGWLVAGSAPVRTLTLRGVVVALLLVALSAATRRLRETSPRSMGDGQAG